MKNKLYKKIFYIFLIINMFLSFCVELFRNTISVDSMEAITWGELISFGTNKHPPLSGWLADGFYHLFFQHDFAIYLLGILCIAIGLIYTYKLASCFLDSKKAICATLIITSSSYYSYLVFYYNFNCNILAMALWPALVYYFYKSTKFDKIKDWVKYGVVAALCFLAKYQIIFLFFGIFLYLLLCERKYFKKKGLYIAFIVGFMLILPHLIWLYQNDFFPFNYYVDKVQLGDNSEKSADFLVGIFYTIRFYIEQFLALLPCFIIYLLLILKEKKVGLKNINENKKDSYFILSIGLVPLVVTGLAGLITSNSTTGAWGSSMVGHIGLVLFYFLPIEFKDTTFKYFFKWLYGVVICSQLALLVFVLVQTKTDMGISRQELVSGFNKIWAENTGNNNIKYVYGSYDYIFHFMLDKNSKSTVILETFGHKNPWVDYKDIEKSGVLILSCHVKEINALTKSICPYLNENYKVEPQKFYLYVKNRFNFKRKYTIYYVIVPPIDTNA